MSNMLALILTTILILAGIIYIWLQKQYSYFQGQEIEYDRPTYLLGTFKDVFLKKENLWDNWHTIYNKFNSG